MTTDKETTAAERTAATMHDTADKLEVAEAILHHSAERSPDTGATARLHALGDQVTAQAQDIDHRADRLTQDSLAASRPDPERGTGNASAVNDEQIQPPGRNR